MSTPLDPIFGTGIAGCTWWDIPTHVPLKDATTAWEIEFAKRLPDVLEAAEAGLSMAGDLVAFDPDAAEGAGLSEMDIPAIQRIVDGLNASLSKGYLSVDSDWHTIVSKSPAFKVGVLGSGTIGTLTASIEVEVKWWGTQIKVSKDLVRKLAEEMLKGGSALTAVAIVMSWFNLIGVAIDISYIIAFCFAVWFNMSIMDWCNGVQVLIFHNAYPPFVVKTPIL